MEDEPLEHEDVFSDEIVAHGYLHVYGPVNTDELLDLWDAVGTAAATKAGELGGGADVDFDAFYQDGEEYHQPEPIDTGEPIREAREADPLTHLITYPRDLDHDTDYEALDFSNYDPGRGGEIVSWHYGVGTDPKTGESVFHVNFSTELGTIDEFIKTFDKDEALKRLDQEINSHKAELVQAQKIRSLAEKATKYEWWDERAEERADPEAIAQFIEDEPEEPAP
jgi:hypothetical protein